MYIFANGLTETALTTPCMVFLMKHFFFAVCVCFSITSPSYITYSVSNLA